MSFYYHGSINRERLPLNVLDALRRASDTATITIVGYETIGSEGYMNEVLSHARLLGIAHRVDYRGSIDRRSDLLRLAATADVGLAFMPIHSNDTNLQHMVGASNKPFDYLATGLMMLVSDLHDWRKMFVEPGYAKACNPANVDSLAAMMRWSVEHPAEVRRMGEAGRQRIAADWHYERQFLTVSEAISSLS
ncbi:MAG: glycosyltransferase [Pseudomonadota bacterium]